MLLSVLIPVFNETATIERAIAEIAAALPGVQKELVIVDDFSRDGSREWLQARYAPAVCEEGAAPPPAAEVGPDTGVVVVLHARNRGKGAAIRTAMAAARGDVVVVQDADLEYDPADWVRMYDLIARKRIADVVYGSRFYGLPHRSLYFHHYLANRTISLLFNVLFNQTLTDIEVCTKMFTRAVLQSLRLDCDDFGIEVQITAQIARARHWRIYECGVQYFGRTYAEGKKIGWRDGVRALYYVVKYRFAR